MNLNQFAAFIKNCAIKLSRGSHSSPQDGMCIMECVAYIAGEKHTDRPKCACSYLTGFAIKLNDIASFEQRQRLLPFIMRLANSRLTGKGAYAALEERARIVEQSWTNRTLDELVRNAHMLDWSNLQKLSPFSDNLHPADYINPHKSPYSHRPCALSAAEVDVRFAYLLDVLDKALRVGEQEPSEDAPVVRRETAKLQELATITSKGEQRALV